MTRQLIRSQGLTGLYRGLTPAILGAGPAHALYYAVYEQTKAALGARRPGQRPAAVAAAGAPLYIPMVATSCGCASSMCSIPKLRCTAQILHEVLSRCGLVHPLVQKLRPQSCFHQRNQPLDLLAQFSLAGLQPKAIQNTCSKSAERSLAPGQSHITLY